MHIPGCKNVLHIETFVGHYGISWLCETSKWAALYNLPVAGRASIGI